MIPTAFFVSSTTLAIAGLGAAITPIQGVWNPKILYPKAGTQWIAGDHHNVTWSTTNAPANVSEPSQVTIESASQNYGPITLASGFDLLLGRVVIQIPIFAPAAEDYTVTLYGDSSNVSPEFEMLIQGS